MKEREPGVVEPLEPWGLGNRPIAWHRTASVVLVRDEAWKVAPKSIALEAGRLGWLGGVSLPSAQAYAIPSYNLSGATDKGAQPGGAWGWFLRAGAVAVETTLAVPGKHLAAPWERPSAKTQQPPSQVKPALHAGSSPQKRSPELRRLNFHPHSQLTHSPTHFAHLLGQPQPSSSPAQLDQNLTRPDKASPV